jgi:hypothetical protein
MALRKYATWPIFSISARALSGDVSKSARQLRRLVSTSACHTESV